MKNFHFWGQLSSTKMLSVTNFWQCVIVLRRNYKYLPKYTVNKNRNERQLVKKMLLEINKNLLAKLKQLPFLLQIWGHNKTAWQCNTWNKLQKLVTEIVGFFINLVKILFKVGAINKFLLTYWNKRHTFFCNLLVMKFFKHIKEKWKFENIEKKR